MPAPFAPRTPGALYHLTLLVVAAALAGCARQPEIPVELREFYIQIQDSALRFPQKEGAWDQHYGDAPYYGTAFYARAPQRDSVDPGLPRHAALATTAVGHNLRILRQAQADRAYFLANLEEVMMSALGLIEYSAVSGDRSVLPDVDAAIEIINGFTVALGYYIDVDAGMFAIKTYGPTAISAGVALLNLQYAKYIGGEYAADRRELARSIVEAVDQKAWDGARYRISPRDNSLELYPNTMMMAVLCRLHEQLHAPSSDSPYLRRAEQVFSAIQPLRSPRGGYKSPYSADAMGAKTDDYSTLSSQNYLTLALTLLYQNTHRQAYFDEALFVLEFVRTHLYDPSTGHILHHFIDGRIALPSDPEYFCTGCNLQFLYAVYLLSLTSQPAEQ